MSGAVCRKSMKVRSSGGVRQFRTYYFAGLKVGRYEFGDTLQRREAYFTLGLDRIVGQSSTIKGGRGFDKGPFTQKGSEACQGWSSLKELKGELHTFY